MPKKYYFFFALIPLTAIALFASGFSKGVIVLGLVLLLPMTWGLIVRISHLKQREAGQTHSLLDLKRWK